MILPAANIVQDDLKDIILRRFLDISILITVLRSMIKSQWLFKQFIGPHDLKLGCVDGNH